MKLWNRFLCWMGFHEWEYLSNDLCTNPQERQPFEYIASHQQCVRCGILIDNRCKDCVEHGTGTCFRRYCAEEEYRRLRRNCCIHCPRTYHKH